MKSGKYPFTISYIGSGLTISIGATAMLGWYSGLRLLTSIHHNYIPMMPNTAAAFIALGMATLVLHCRSFHRALRWFSSCISVCIITMGILTLAKFFHLTAFDIDHLLLKYSGEVLLSKYHGFGMSPLTAGNFLLMGISLFLLTLPSNNNHCYNVAACLAAVASMVGFIVLLGYFYESPILYGGNTTPMALNTACAFVCSGTNLILLAGLECKPASYFTGASMRARLMRSFFPVLVFATIFDEFVLDTFITQKLSNPAIAVGINTILSGGIIGFMVFFMTKKIGGSIDLTETIRKHVEDALRESEARFRAIFEGIGDGIILADKQTRAFRYVNPAICSMTGYSKDELTQMHLQDIHPEDDLPHVIEEFDLSAKGEKNINLNIPVRRKNGGILYANIRTATIPLNDKEYLMGVFRDITAQKMAETELRKAHSLLTTVSEGSTDAIFIKDVQGRYLLFNNGAARATGRIQEEVIGKDDYFLFPPHEAQAIMDSDRRVMESEQIVTYEEVVTTVMGTTTYLSTKGPVYDDKGEIIGLFGIARDITRRKQAEDALRKSEERFRSIFEQAGVGAAIIDSETGRFLRANRKYAEILGYNPDEMPALSFREITHPDDLPADLDNMEKLRKGLISEFSMEKRYFRKNGNVVWVSLTISPLWLEGDGLSQHIAIVSDITGRKQADEKLRKITESAFDAIVMIDENGGINYWNAAAEAMFGYTKDEAMGKDVHTLLLPEDYTESYRHGMKAFRTNGTGAVIGKRLVMPARRKDGLRFYAEHSFASFQSDSGWNAVSVIRDCTERKHYEDGLKKLNETLEQRVAERTNALLAKNDEMFRLSQAVEQSPTCVVITDTNGDIEYVNPRFVELTGYSLNEVKGENPRILKSGKTPPERYTDLWNTITSGKTWQGEFINQKKNGALYREFASISPLKNSEGKITQYLAFKSDITEIRALEEEQQTLREHLYHAQKLESVGSLAGGIAHDFNNMLMAIMGYTELAEEETAGESPAKMYLRKVLEYARKATDLTQNLLTFSRRQPVSLSPVHLNSIITNIERLLLKAVGENIVCTFNLSDKDIKVLADSDKIEQIMMNLANNAVAAMPDGGSLTISTDVIVLDSKSANKYGLDKNGTYGVITVSDTGTGMNEAVRERIFEPFFTTKERGKGTGLGLPIVYGMVKQHNGHIEVISAPGKGATFNIYLPTTGQETVRTDAETEIRDNAPAEPKTILLAEDEEGVRELVVRILEHAGYHVIPAVNGEDAVKKFEEYKDRIDMLLFDVMMPKKSGKDAYHSIKKLRPDMKVLFMSGYLENIITDKEIREEGLSFIQKPMDPGKLLKKLRETLLS